MRLKHEIEKQLVFPQNPRAGKMSANIGLDVDVISRLRSPNVIAQNVKSLGKTFNGLFYS